MTVKERYYIIIFRKYVNWKRVVVKGEQGMGYKEIVDRVREIYEDGDARGVFEHIAIQINITGEVTGCFYMEVADRKISVEPYDYHDKDVLVEIDTQTLLETLDGKITPQEAYKKGRIKVMGNLDKAELMNRIILDIAEEKEKN